MKVKLLKKVRECGRSQISIQGIVKQDGVIIGMSIGMNSRSYSSLFDYGDTEEVVLKKAEQIYLSENIESIRNEYKKYSRLNCRQFSSLAASVYFPNFNQIPCY